MTNKVFAFFFTLLIIGSVNNKQLTYNDIYTTIQKIYYIKQKKVVNKIKVKLDKFYKKFLCKIRKIVFTIYNYIDTLNYNFKNDLRNLE